MSKKLLPNKLGKVFLMIGIICAVSEIENASAQNKSIEIRCIKEIDVDVSHQHLFRWDTSESEMSYRCHSYDGRYCTNSDYHGSKNGFGTNGNEPRASRTDTATFYIKQCAQWAMFINGKQINDTNAFFAEIPAAELLKIYDPNYIYK